MLRGIGRGALELALALLAFLCGTWLVRAALPPAAGGRLEQKLAVFAAAKDEYDAVAIGSSRVLYSLDPRVLAEELGRAGVALRTFNLGVLGLDTFEQDWLLKHVLALRPARLRWIFYESGPVGVSLARHHPYGDVARPPTARDVQWHTLDGTRTFLGALARVPLPRGRKLALARDHLALALRNLASVGRGPDLVAALRGAGVEHERALHALVRRTEGFQPIDRTATGTDGQVRAAHAALAQVTADNARAVALDELDTRVYRAQVAAAAALGVELLYVTLPSYEGSPELLRLHERGIVPALLHFNDPERHPELFTAEERFDAHHLNRRGAERLSRALAHAFLRHLGRGGED